jgi:arylsulfatase A-like enzyme
LLLAACSREPDVIFLTVDTLRVDHVGAFDGDSPAKTPNMDRLAADGIRFTQAFSPISVTGPAFCTLHTGKDPGSHGVVMNLFRGGQVLDVGETTLAELLVQGGWRSGAFVSGFTLRPELGLWQGFHHYDSPGQALSRRPGDETATKATTWMAQQEDPTFLWFHSFDAHGPLKLDRSVPAASRFEGEPGDLEHIPHYQRIRGLADPAFYRARYAKHVERTDAQVGQILAELDRQGRYEGALIVLVADHGETLDERELWFDHGYAASVEQLQVPLVIKLPKGAQAGTTRTALTGLKDVMPTVLAALGLRAPKGLDGASQLAPSSPGHPALTGESSHCKKEGPLRCSPSGPAGKEFAVRTPTLTVLRKAEGTPVWHQHDRRADPGERTATPLGEDHASLRATLEEMARHRASMGLLDPGEATGDGAELEALKSLGYIDP